MVRISGGIKKRIQLKKRKASFSLRPITEKIKNAIFSIIVDEIKDAVVLDLFAGTGIFGFEALSRGAQHVTFVDKEPRNIKLIEENANLLQFSQHVRLINKDFRRAIRFLAGKKSSFSLIFIDPPYNTNFAYESLSYPPFFSLLREDSLVIVRVHHKKELLSSISGMHLVDKRRYGEVRIYFYKK